MKKINFLFILMLAMVIVVGCSSQSNSNGDAPTLDANTDNDVENNNSNNEGNNNDGEIKLGALWPSAGIPSVQSKMEATDQMAEELGAKVVSMDAQFDARTQSEQAKNLLAQNVDGVLVDIIDPQAIIPAMKELHEAGIPVIVTTLPIEEDGEEYVSFVGSDNFNGGKLAAELLDEALEEKGGKVAIIEGAPGVLVSERTNGFKEGIESTNLEFVEAQSSPWDRQKALDIMQDFLTKYPDIEGVFVHEDAMVPGVYQAIKQAGKEDQVKIIGYGATIDGTEMIEDGTMYGSIVEDLWWEAQEGVRLLMGAIENGEEIPKETLGEQRKITKDDLGDYESKNH